MGFVGRAVVFVACFALTLELATRLDQKMSYGAPLWGKYTYDSVLYAKDEYGIRGRPNAVYEKWRLNSLGFRGPEVALAKTPGRIRIACFGASETFGLYETPGNDWPRQLERALGGPDAHAEVLNVALAGMSLHQRVAHFEHRIVSLQPDLVILMLEFPSYAGLTPEKIILRNAGRQQTPDDRAAHPVEIAQSIRALSKLKHSVLPKLPQNAQDLFRAVELRLKLMNLEGTLGHDFRSLRDLKQVELDAFEADVRRFYEIAVQHGISLIVASPAMWDGDEQLLLFYTSWPYIDESWIQAARRQFPETARRIAGEKGFPFVDLSAAVAGREPVLMKDEVHFSDEGARVVADVLAAEIRKVRHDRTISLQIAEY